MKKTALTMTDSEKLSAGKSPELSEFHPRTHQEENQALRIIVEQQEIAMDMIMRKYREQVDNLTKVSHSDVKKLYYKRFLDTIVNQANKMDKMTTMMRKNLLIIFKYEEVMRQIESENESLRALVSKLTSAVKEAERKADVGKVIKIEAASQTLTQENPVSTAYKSVGTSMVEHKPEIAPDIPDKCTDVIPYTPLSESFAHFGPIQDSRPVTQPLDVDAAFDSYVNRFCGETHEPIHGRNNLHNISLLELDAKSPLDVRINEMFEGSSEEITSSASLLPGGDELSSDNSIVSLTDDSCSKIDSSKPFLSK